MRSTCTLASPLSQKQKTVWSLINKGLSAVTIADKLNTTRQLVNQTKLAAEARLSTTLLDVAQANDLQITKTIPKRRHTFRLSPSLKTQSHPHLQHKLRNKSLVLARQPWRNYKRRIPKTNPKIPAWHRQRKRNRSQRSGENAHIQASAFYILWTYPGVESMNAKKSLEKRVRGWVPKELLELSS